MRLWRRAYCREAVTRRAEEEPRRRTSVSFFLWRTTEQAGVPLGGFARKNGRWVGLRLFAFRWADSISQFEPSYIHTTVRRTHTNTHTLHAYMTGGPCHLGAQGGCPACQHYRAGPGAGPNSQLPNSLTQPNNRRGDDDASRKSSRIHVGERARTHGEPRIF